MKHGHMREENVAYHLTYLSKEELIEKLQDKLDPIELNKVISAYEMAEHVHQFQIRSDGSPYFYHATRVAKILIDELQIYDADVIAAALLHDVLEDSEYLTPAVLQYNFGPYVAYIVEVLTKDLELQKIDPHTVEKEHIQQLKNSSSDCLIIRLAAKLDNFRSLRYNLKKNPFRYIQETAKYYFPLAENSQDPRLKKLLELLRRERNKFLG